jgi:hypothetical protein
MPAGAQLIAVGVDVSANLVEVCARGPDGQALAGRLAERYGDRVRLVWEGPDGERIVPVSWQVWDAAPEDQQLVTIGWQTNSAYRFERAEVEETADSVQITVFEAQPAGFVTLAGAGRAAEVRLQAPVGTRRIIDTVTGRPRPHV